MKKADDNNLNQEEQDILDSFNRGEWKPVKNQQQAKSEASASAAFTLKKDARLNIRISKKDLIELKRKAAHEGMPYQTLIASVLHKYLNGALSDSQRPH